MATTIPRVLLVLLFLLALFLPGAGSLLGGGEGARENRQLAGFPPLPSGLAELGSFRDGFDAFLKDNFALRSQLVKLHSLLNARLGVSMSEQVVIGRGGWFYLDIYELAEHNRGAMPFAPRELASFVRGLEQRQAYLESLGIPLLLVVVPEKQSIYPEYLPASLAIQGPSRLQQFRDAAASRLPLVDLYPLILAEKPRLPQYFQTDSHWNCAAAAIAYQQMGIEASRRLGRGGVKIPGVSVERGGRAPAQDLTAIMLGLPGVFAEDNAATCIPSRQPVYTATRFADGFVAEPGFYKVPTHETWVFENQAVPVLGGTVLVFRDSFAVYFLRYLIPLFDKVVFAGQADLSFSPELVQQVQPDLVIYQFAERMLSQRVRNPGLPSAAAGPSPTAGRTTLQGAEHE